MTAHGRGTTLVPIEGLRSPQSPQPQPHDELRGLLFSIAYRMLGSVSDAEDIVQDAFLRFHRTSAERRIQSPKAWLTKTTTNLAIDHLRSARVRREQYVGPWLPEPLIADPSGDPAERAEHAETLSLAFLVVLESLTPVERAVFILRDALDYGYDEIAEIVGRSPENCRQLAVRARRHVEDRKPRFEASRERRDELADRFFAAVGDGDADQLVQLLAADAVVYGDGGGKAPAAREPVRGRERVARFLVALARQAEPMGVRTERVVVNGQPGALFLAPDGRLVSVLALDIAGGSINALHSMLNPEKIAHIAPPADVEALLRGRRRGGSR